VSVNRGVPLFGLFNMLIPRILHAETIGSYRRADEVLTARLVSAARQRDGGGVAR
jgi:hypothetical protein